jgi:hypothetical protein
VGALPDFSCAIAGWAGAERRGEFLFRASAAGDGRWAAAALRLPPLSCFTRIRFGAQDGPMALVPPARSSSASEAVCFNAAGSPAARTH